MMICLAELNYVLCNVGLPCSVRNSQRTGGIQARMTGVDHRTKNLQSLLFLLLDYSTSSELLHLHTPDTATLSTTKGIDPLHGMSDLWWVFDCNLILPLPLTLQPQGLLVSCLDSGI
ncbi:uncharacterized protein LOC143233561 isoform X2 [Tachypleus tridentatus]|uniref:uncharacterized protein LOC143233558 isoform X2 n=1 Tax=Tachypleus tridentatus TaxID=6853 RepID=UPI003FD1A969